MCPTYLLLMSCQWPKVPVPMRFTTVRVQAMGEQGSVPATAGELLHLVRTGQATTRKALQNLSGLSRSTLTGRLDALQAAGWLAESGQADSTGGRPAKQLRFN